MSDSWDERRRAQEERYFETLNKQALARLAEKKGQPARHSPVTGKPMEQITFMGVVADRCVDSGGLWLDAGELEQVLAAAKESDASLKDFISAAPSLTPQSAVEAPGRTSPITGKPMNQEKILGVTIDKCADSGGIWLDAGELERLVKSSHQSLTSGVKDFFAMVLGRR